ncbi:hypothetical protein DNTS_003556 [Danionella cerebrum]|uniref:Uncharacterized protein n=1 Tax=Danionella cerebrum TaxID=2873325 RepID=A0A553Q5P0_9TELE|nr:hypothetical protein DNTS_003556 [Danionella translucida]
MAGGSELEFHVGSDLEFHRDFTFEVHEGSELEFYRGLDLNFHRESGLELCVGFGLQFHGGSELKGRVLTLMPAKNTTVMLFPKAQRWLKSSTPFGQEIFPAQDVDPWVQNGVEGSKADSQEEHDGHEDQQPEHLDLSGRSQSESALGARVSGDISPHHATHLAHPDQRATHGEITEHRDGDQQEHEPAVQERVRGAQRVHRAPVQKAPRPREMSLVLPKTKTWHDAQYYIAQICRNERQPSHSPVHMLRIEVRVVYGQVPLHRHCAQNRHPGGAEKQHGEGEEVTQKRPSRPPASDVSGDDHRTGEARAQQVGDGHAAHQHVECGLLLLLLGDAQHHNGNQVSEDSDPKHSCGGDERAVVQAERAERAVGENF